MSKVKLLPSGESIYVDNSKSLLQSLQENGTYIKSSCGGHASCGDCIVKICEGVDNLNSPTFEETKLLGNVFHITKERLSCQCIVDGDILIDISNQDKASDEERRDSKSKKVVSKFKVRKKVEFDKIIEERRENSSKKQEKDESWQKHWEKEGVKFDKSMGGSRRPRGLKDLDLEKERREIKRSRENEESEDD